MSRPLGDLEAMEAVQAALKLARHVISAYGGIVEADTFTPRLYPALHEDRLARLSAYRSSLERQTRRASERPNPKRKTP